LRLGVDLVEALKSVASPGAFLRITPGQLQQEQVIHIALVEPKREERKRTLRRHQFVSVRPDWLDGKGVLGFYNPLTEEYAATPFVGRLIEAFAEPDHPHFVILDEMNLARVEHY